MATELEDSLKRYKYFDPRTWTYLYDLYPLAKNLDKYVDHSQLNLAATKGKLPDVLRIMITTVDVMTSMPLVFDNTFGAYRSKANSNQPWISYIWFSMDWNRR
jgi:hypothetical protein